MKVTMIPGTTKSYNGRWTTLRQWGFNNTWLRRTLTNEHGRVHIDKVSDIESEAYAEGFKFVLTQERRPGFENWFMTLAEAKDHARHILRSAV